LSRGVPKAHEVATAIVGDRNHSLWQEGEKPAMRLDDVLDVIIGKAQQKGKAAFHSADGRIHKGEVVVARSAAVAFLDARSVILGESDTEGLLHL
jgi:hypothetical protein